MLATITSKGQITLPKPIRDQLGLDTGAVLDFQVLADNTISVRQVKPDARRIRGLLKSPHAKALTVVQMDQAVGQLLRSRHGKAMPAEAELAQTPSQPGAAAVPAKGSIKTDRIQHGRR